MRWAGRPGSGFTLIETVVALAIVGLTLLGVISSIWHYRLASERFDAQRSALRSLEAAHETLRAGAAPLEPGPFTAPLPVDPGGVAPEIEIEVERTMRPGLRRVVLRCRYPLHGYLHEQAIETLFWRP